ncbi:MAG: tryptophan synthase subunit alpha [Paraprevotella sp.]|nr:tryptophan synthase subunit alpha [Paraprevotella sp.]
MNRINKIFEDKKKGLLSLYFCAGHPTPDSTATIIETLEKNQIDFVEVGIPFTDPMADGPVIQDAATKSLRNGTTLSKIFAQVKEARIHGVEMPLILMGYLNPIYHMGYEEFFRNCKEADVDGVIIPDLPFNDYLQEVKPIADSYNIRIIMLITPETSDERIHFIDDHTDGFIYMVSSAATTGAQKEFDQKKQAYFNKVNNMSLKHPRMIGFGISNKQTLESAQANAAGAIIGSKFVTLLDELQDAQKAVNALKEALTK